MFRAGFCGNQNLRNQPNAVPVGGRSTVGHHTAGANWHKKEQTGLPRRSKARTECREQDTPHDSTCVQPRKSGLTCSDREQVRALHQLVLRDRDGRREDRDRVQATVTFSILTVVPIPWLCRLVQCPHTVLNGFAIL